MGRKPKSVQVTEENQAEESEQTDTPKEFATTGKAVGSIPLGGDKFLIFTVEVCVDTGNSRNFTIVKESSSHHQALYDFKSTAIKNKLL